MLLAIGQILIILRRRLVCVGRGLIGGAQVDLMVDVGFKLGLAIIAIRRCCTCHRGAFRYNVARKYGSQPTLPSDARPRVLCPRRATLPVRTLIRSEK
jgi:hypothetical protein